MRHTAPLLLLSLIASSAAAQAPASAPLKPGAPAKSTKSSVERIADNFTTLFGPHPGSRLAHAKGVVVLGTFTPSPAAAGLSKAAHFAKPVPVLVRFSNGTGIPTIPDTDPNSYPIGIALRFDLGGGKSTDIVANSHDGFVAATGEEMAEFTDALVATKPDSKHPTPIEQFLGAHPRALKFVTDKKLVPESFATETWFGNNAMVFVNAKGEKQAVRYRLGPVGAPKYLTEAATKTAGPNYLYEELPKRLAAGPAKLKLSVQLANAGDQTKDGTAPWPADRKVVELGTIELTKVAPNSDALQRELAFNPIYVTDGIQLSDDPLLLVRSSVYAISVARRRQK